MEFLILLLFLWLPMAFVSMCVADAKQCSGSSWFFVGLLFGPLGLIGAAGLPDRRLHRLLAELRDQQEAV